MKFTQRVFQAGILTASIALLWAYSLELFWLGAATAVGLGFIGWFGKDIQKWPWGIDMFLAGSVILVSIGALLDLKLYLLLIAMLGALAAWDIARFQQRIGPVPIRRKILRIEKRHLALLAGALAAGGIFAGMVLTTHIQLSFGAVLVLGIILLISLGQIYRTLRN